MSPGTLVASSGNMATNAHRDQGILHPHLQSARDSSQQERSYYDESRRVYGSVFASIYNAVTAPLRPAACRSDRRPAT